MVAALVSTAALGGCGSSSQTLSAHDHSAVKQFGVLVRQYQSLEKAIGADTIAGSGIHSRERYIVQDGPRIDQLSKTADSIRQVVASIQNLTLAKLEDPLSEALYAEATDLVRFLNILRQPNTPNRRSVINSQLQTSYAKIGDDEQRIKQRGTRATAQGGSLRQKPLWLEHRGDAGGWPATGVILMSPLRSSRRAAPVDGCDRQAVSPIGYSSARTVVAGVGAGAHDRRRKRPPKTGFVSPIRFCPQIGSIFFTARGRPPRELGRIAVRRRTPARG